ncbi:hypothetical protein T484DRAFT_1964487 [Baffinella frigidus]|nr:hypothetical protein T484DRAFT_1964487 [Cryptophyta sp. CCMP2293]
MLPRAGKVEEGAVELMLWFENLNILGARGHATAAVPPPQDPPAAANTEPEVFVEEDDFLKEEEEEKDQASSIHRRWSDPAAGAVLQRSATRSPRLVVTEEDESVASTHSTPRRVMWGVHLVIEKSAWAKPQVPPDLRTPPAKSPRPIIKASSWNPERFTSHALNKVERELSKELDEVIQGETKELPAGRKHSWKSWLARLANPAKSVKRLISGEGRAAASAK